MNFDYGFDNGYDLYRQNMKRDSKKIFSRIGIGLFAYLAVALAVTLIAEVALMLILGDKFNELLDNVYFTALLGLVPQYAVGLPIFFAIIAGMPKKQLKKSKIAFSEFLVILAIAEALMFIGNMVGNTLNSFISLIIEKDIANSTSDLIEKMPYWLIILLVVIIAPLVEELIFRKLIIDRLSRCGNILAIAVSAVAFGLVHGNLYQFFYATLLGILFGYVYVKSGRLIYSYILHAIINFLGSVVVIPIMKMSNELVTYTEQLYNGEVFDIKRFMICSMAVSSYSVIQYVIAIVGFILLVMAFRKRLIKIKSEPHINIPREDVISVTVFNVGCLLFIAASLLSIVASIFVT